MINLKLYLDRVENLVLNMIHFLRLHHGGKHNFDHLAVL